MGIYLDEKEILIVYMHALGKVPLSEIARDYGVPRKRVQRIWTRAVRRMRRSLEVVTDLGEVDAEKN